MTFPPRPRAGACWVWLPRSLTPRGFPVDLAAAPPPACLRLREVPGSPGGSSPRNLWVRVGGGRPHIRCPELVPQVACQAGQRPMPRRLRVPLRSAGRHSALTAGPLPRQAPPFVLALLSVVGAAAFLPRPLCAPRAAVGSAVQAVPLHRWSAAVPLGRGLSATGGGSGRLRGPAGCGAPAGAAMRAGSGPGPGPRAGPGDDGSAGRAGGPVGGAWCCWGAGPSCVLAGRSCVPDIARAWGVRPSVGPVVWGCTVSEGRAAVVSVGVAVCACVGGPSGGVYAGSPAGRSGVPWCGRASGWARVAAAWLAASCGPCPGATGGVRGCGLPVGLGAGSLCGCAVLGGCSGWMSTAPVFVGLGMAPLPAGNARCPRFPVAVWCCVGCRCAARLDARSCQGLSGVPAPDGAGSPVVCVAFSGVLLVWCNDGCGGGGGGRAAGRGGRCGRCSGPYICGPSCCRGAGSGREGGVGRGGSPGGVGRAVKPGTSGHHPSQVGLISYSPIRLT